MKNFETKQEAQTNLEKSKLKMLDKICPLTWKPCIESCMSFYPGEIYIMANKQFRQYDAKCKNPLVSGDLFIESI